MPDMVRGLKEGSLSPCADFIRRETKFIPALGPVKKRFCREVPNVLRLILYPPLRCNELDHGFLRQAV